ncbi:unnamed protein product [Effrenium voratum]|nr:unnamed protein product [Effrenium voratum]
MAAAGLAPNLGLFCPPLGPACRAPEESGPIELEVLCEKLLFAALSRSYEIPRGSLAPEISQLFQLLLRNLQEGIEALRLLACMSSFRSCYGNSTFGRPWRHLRSLVKRASSALVSAAEGIFGAYGVPLNLVEIPRPAAEIGGLPEIFDGVETFYRAFEMAFDPIMGDVIPQVLERKSRLDRQSRSLRVYSPDFPPEATGTQLWQRYPDTFAPACSSPGSVHQRGQAREGIFAYDMSGLRMAHRTVEEALDEIAKARIDLSFQLVNLGAMDGRCSGGPSTDPANCLLQGSTLFNRSWGGVVVEASPPAILFERFGGRSDIAVVPLPVFPENASAIFGYGVEAPAGAGLDLLKIDLDSFDCDIVATMLRIGPLAQNPPKLLYIDINPHIPPPFLYRTMSSSQSRIIPFQGSSLQCFLEASKGRFRLLHVELFNALLVRQDLADIFPEIQSARAFDQWAAGYFCHPLARVLWHRERMVRWAGTDPRVWADERLTLAQRGESLLQTLGRVRLQTPTFEFSLTW